jgi:hypothetical protein
MLRSDMASNQPQRRWLSEQHCRVSYPIVLIPCVLSRIFCFNSPTVICSRSILWRTSDFATRYSNDLTTRTVIVAVFNGFARFVGVSSKSSSGTPICGLVQVPSTVAAGKVPQVDIQQVTLVGSSRTPRPQSGNPCGEPGCPTATGLALARWML